MSNSLFAALSGLSAHQQWIDVIGNNIANSNTTGYKSNRATFASAFAQTLRFGSAPTGGLGGTNPLQIGLGVAFGSIDRTFSQGALTNTGRIFDLALEGKGFFSLSNGNERFYTRVGTFGLDAEQNLVDQRTGLSVLDPGGNALKLDVDALFPPSATENSVGLVSVLPHPSSKLSSGSAPLPLVLDTISQPSATPPEPRAKSPFCSSAKGVSRVAVDQRHRTEHRELA